MTEIKKEDVIYEEKEKKDIFYLPNGMAPLWFESKNWTFSEKTCNGKRTNGKSNVELTTKFGGQWIVQYGRSSRTYEIKYGFFSNH